MARALDEPDAVYGLIAQSADVAADKKSVTFRLRPEAKFADGTPVTAEDAAWTFETPQDKGVPGYGAILRDVEKAEVIDPLTIRYTFKGEQVRDLPINVASLPVLPKAFYASRDFEAPFLDKPLGSGPYAVGEFKQGSHVVYTKRDDYWAKDLAVNRGQLNFANIRYEYFRDDDSRPGSTYVRHDQLPRGILLAKLGDALCRCAGHQGWPHRQRSNSRPTALGHAGILPQSAARQVQGCARPRGSGFRLRLPVAEEEHLLWPVRAGAELFREQRPESQRPAFGCRARIAGALARQGRRCRVR